MKTRFLVFFFLMASLGDHVCAQSKDAYNMWYQYLLAAKVTNKSTITALSQYRSFDFAYDTRLFLASAYMDYEVLPDVKPAAGFMFLVLESYTDDDTKKVRYEKRPFQQITLKSDIGRVTASHRFRVEERFLTNPNAFIVRLRYLISLNIPFYKSGEKEKFYGIFKNEIRMNAQRENMFDSNRITAGFGWKMNKKSALELGLIKQLEDGPSTNYGSITYRNSFDWRRKDIKQDKKTNF